MTKEEIELAMEIAEDADLPDGAYWAFVAECLGVEVDDVWAALAEGAFDEENNS